MIEQLRPLLLHEGRFLEGKNPKYPYDWQSAYGGATALLLVCPGDGRHWVNVTTSCPRAYYWAEEGNRVIGLVDDVEAALRLLGTFPHQGEALCERCLKRPG